MMDSPEARALVVVPWLFGRQGLCLLLLVTAVAATFLATDVTYLAGALLLVGLGANAWAALAFVGVAYSRRTSRSRAFCGDELFVESVLANPRPLPLPWLEIWEKLPAELGPEGGGERSYAEPGRTWVRRGLALWPYQRLRWRRRLVCHRRGVFRLGEARLRTGDPFGFIERELIWSDGLELLVYPRVVPLRRLGLPLHHPSLDVSSPSSPIADPTRTATVRDYRPDDSRRMIHWPTTARRGSLQVRVLEPATSLHVSLLLDLRGFTFGAYVGLLEEMLSALASIAVFLQNQGSPFALVANTKPPLVIPPGASVAHLQHVLECLARLEPNAGPSLFPGALEDLPRGNTAVLAAADASADVQHTRRGLEDVGFHVLLLLAARQPQPHGSARADTISITPGCDLSARLEGRG